MPTKKTNIISIINIILLVIYFFTILFFSFNDDSSNMNFNSDKISNFNEGWTISYNDIVEETTILPINYHLEPGTKYSIERVINEEDFIYPVIRIRSSMMDVYAYIDDELIYSFEVNKNFNNFQEPYPASWQLIDIPVGMSIGKTLKIVFSSPTTQFSGLLNSIVIGRGEAIILDLLHENFLNFIISCLIILLSIFALTTLFWTKKLEISKHIFYLASFGIAAGFWIISESTLLQIFLPNRFLVSSTSYILNLILPLIIALFFRDIVLEGFHKLMTILASSFFYLLVIEFILQLTGTVSFIDSTILSIILIFINATILIFCLINEGYKKNNARARHYIFIFFTLFIFVAIIMGLFIFGIYQDLGKYLASGVFIFYLLVMSDTIKSINGLLETRNKSLIYKQLAYEDYLTKGWNRTAFEQDIENLITKGEAFRLVLLDLNHLKQINDTYGHIEGDYAIKSSYNSIKTNAKDNGKSYRISGDEFACIFYDISDETFETFKENINKTLKVSSKAKPYKIVLASGTKVYNKNENFTDFYKKVDIEMYKNKKILKAMESSLFSDTK